MITKAVILCGGMATRFLPISKVIPKEMLPILDKPMLHLILEKLKDAGITDVLIIVGRGKECILNYFDKNIELENLLQERKKYELIECIEEPNNMLNIFYKRQLEPLGTGYSLNLAKNFVNKESFILTFGDEFVLNNEDNYFKDMIDTFYGINKNLIAVSRVDKKDVNKYGIIDFSKEKNDILKVNKIVEKPKIEDAPSDLSYIGTAILKNEIFNILEDIKISDKNEEIGVTKAYEILAQKDKLYAKKIYGERLDIGNKLGFLKANILSALSDKNLSEELKNFLKTLNENF